MGLCIGLSLQRYQKSVVGCIQLPYAVYTSWSDERQKTYPGRCYSNRTVAVGVELRNFRRDGTVVRIHTRSSGI